MSQYVSRWQKLATLPKKIALRLSDDGPVKCVAWCWYQFAWRLCEWRLGINTREFAHGVQVADRGACHGYEPIDHRAFNHILDFLGDRDEAFVDYGCGMGRAVVLAATRPMRRVIGIEIDERLAGIARSQIDRARTRGKLRCQDVEVIAADAAAWQVPVDVTCVFLFNSFAGSLLSDVLEQVRRSLVRCYRPLKLVYVQPVVDYDTLADLPWLCRREELPTGFWKHIRTVVYEPNPTAFERPPVETAAMT